ncbi:MgtC/SapB transporter [Gottschalkia purinilytica]|uniref:MgtC/SapB transporter n=1 Tax=Gottschalkia purinilytica TaxID=1503 RepID=A0A0L0WBJ9_GOTPU|nr:MgtC/SapB family protein [Gottschalkia purinilytica]KNF08856.1 MgtC/SapB transporter [Gottschalkia purinilytica]
MISINQIIFRLVLSIFLSGIIGIERESLKRPAGFRTHILVCVGSTLVMLTSIYMFHSFEKFTTLQPDRLGAQVISGIGFLGAGTIIRQGSSVQGLTTAASLWAVACIGLSVGSGFYAGGIITTILVLFTLMTFGGVEKRMRENKKYMQLKIIANNRPGQIAIVCQEIGSKGLKITKLEFDEENEGDEDIIIINIIIQIPNFYMKSEIIDGIAKKEGVIEVTEK